MGAPNVGKTLQTLWDVSLATLTKEGEEYLSKFAFLDPDSIAMDLFEDLTTTASSGQNASGKLDGEEVFHDALASLAKKSLIELNRIARTIKLHRYLQSTMQARIKRDASTHEHAFRDCLSVLRTKLPPTGFGYHRQPQFWDTRRAYGAHVDFLSVHLAPALNDVTAGILASLLADHA